MNTKLIVRLVSLALFATVLVSSGEDAFGQSYPNKPIRFIVTFPPGGPQDILARVIGKKLTDSWGQQVVIDNRGGANGIIGTEMAAKAVPDGYTILMTYVGTAAINVTLYKKLPYNPVKDFAAITHVASYPFILVVHPSVPAKSVKELIGLAKSKPGQLAYGSAGSGSAGHLGMEQFKGMAGVDIIHVVYKGQAPATTELLGGAIQLMMNNTVLALPHIKAGKLRALAVTGAKRSPAAPDLPTIAEAALPGFEVNSWAGVLAPAGTPTHIVAKLNTEIRKILNMADVQERFSAIGYEPTGNTPEEFAKYIETEIVKWGKVVKASGAQVD